MNFTLSLFGDNLGKNKDYLKCDIFHFGYLIWFELNVNQ